MKFLQLLKQSTVHDSKGNCNRNDEVEAVVVRDEPAAEVSVTNCNSIVINDNGKQKRYILIVYWLPIRYPHFFLILFLVRFNIESAHTCIKCSGVADFLPFEVSLKS